jgi:hypothetical protein
MSSSPSPPCSLGNKQNRPLIFREPEPSFRVLEPCRSADGTLQWTAPAPPPEAGAVSFGSSLKGEKTKEEHCASYQVAQLLGIKIPQFLDRMGGVLTALATVAIAAFTLTLKRATNRLWDAGERQLKLAAENAAAQSCDMQASVEIARRSYASQHRTWLKVYPVEIGPISVGGGKIRVSITIEAENAGNFPAFNVQVGCTPYRARGTVVGKSGIQRLLAEQFQWTQIPDFPPVQTLLPGDKTKSRFSADAGIDAIAEASAAGWEADSVDPIHLTVQLSAVYCVIYKSMASDDWLHSAHSVSIGKKDRSEWLVASGEVPMSNITATFYTPDSDIS